MSQLVGYANNTKWKELQSLMSEWQQKAPYWRTKDINGFIYPPTGWDGDWTYHFRLGEYKGIEWCEMIPRDTEESLSLEEIISTCKRIGFEVEVNATIVRVIGYRRLA